MRLVTQLIKCGLVAAVAAAGFAGNASAQTICAADITAATPELGGLGTCDRIWGDDADEAFVVIDGPVFVLDTRLTILPGTIVRGQPRALPFDAMDPLVGFPGTLIISGGGRDENGHCLSTDFETNRSINRGAFLDARGTPGSPIIFTTAAVDNDNDGVPDDVSPANGEPDAWTPGDDFLDDTPATNPLSTLLSDGTQAYGYHGGLVLIGCAPTNIDDGLVGWQSENTCEGLPVPGVAPAAATYGGEQPHDSTGVLEYFSVRHAGEEIAPNDELNGITLCGIGDGTIVNHGEAYANGDDGFEMFGGTVNLRNIVVAYTGDDAIDIDQGWTGTIQDALTLSIFFNENGGGAVGTGGSGDAAGEFDGEDCADCILNISDGFVMRDPNFAISNWTHVSNVEGAMNGGITNPAVSANGDNQGVEGDTQVNGILANSIFVGMAGGAFANVEYDTSGRENRLIVASTGDTALVGKALRAATDGDTVVAAGTEFVGGSANAFPAVTAQLLVNENHYFVPTGVAVLGRGKLAGAKTTDAGAAGGPGFDPRPAAPANAELSGGIEPHWPGMDRSETYRGAFSSSGDLWTTPWSALNIGGVMVD